MGDSMTLPKSKTTISDVAKTAGVSNSAVSYALNGKPGVSEDTRAKVLDVAERLGWRPNSAAKALSDAKTHNVGLVLTYDTGVLSVESYTMELIAGLTAELETEGYSLLLRSSPSHVEERSILKEWIAAGAVDAVLIMNVELGDSRIDLFKEKPTVPALALCDASMAGGLPALADDEGGAAHLIVDYLHELGHEYIARIAGPEMLEHTFIRDNAFVDEAAELGLRYSCFHTDYSPQGGERCTRRLLSLPDRPTAIVYDNDVMALSSLQTIGKMGFRVPDDLSVVSWNDSFMCEVSRPTITALNRDVVRRGSKAATMLLSLIDGRQVESVQQEDNELIFRQSSGPLGVHPRRGQGHME